MSNMQVRGVAILAHSRSEPEPLLFRFVTLTIDVLGGERCLPLPATVSVPNPTAPGKTVRAEDVADGEATGFVLVELLLAVLV